MSQQTIILSLMWWYLCLIDNTEISLPMAFFLNNWNIFVKRQKALQVLEEEFDVCACKGVEACVCVLRVHARAEWQAADGQVS